MNPAELPLRDLQLPEPVGWWPLAPGWWWLLIGLALILAGIAAWWLWRRDRRARLAHWLLPELRALSAAYGRDGDAIRLVQGLSGLLRRASLSLQPRPEVAGLTREDWLHWLDRVGQTTAFTRGPGRLLADGPYAPAVNRQDAEALLGVVEDWVRRCGSLKLRGAGQ